MDLDRYYRANRIREKIDKCIQMLDEDEDILDREFADYMRFLFPNLNEMIEDRKKELEKEFEDV